MIVIAREGEDHKLACGAGDSGGDVTKRQRTFVGR
jgi:hypothetical protein